MWPSKLDYIIGPRPCQNGEFFHEKRSDNRVRPRVEFDEVFFNLPLVVGHGERRYYFLGQSDGRRRLFVVVAIREGLLRVSSARNMNRREQEVYESE